MRLVSNTSDKKLDGLIDRAYRWVSASQEGTTNRWRNPSWWNLLIFLPWVLGVAFCAYEYNVDRTIAAREQTVTGIVTAHEPAKHNRYGYTFVVQGKQYNGWETPQHAEPVIGQQVLVYYDTLNPKKNALTGFDELSTGSLGPIPFVLVGIGMGAVFVFLKRRHFQRENTQV